MFRLLLEHKKFMGREYGTIWNSINTSLDILDNHTATLVRISHFSLKEGSKKKKEDSRINLYTNQKAKEQLK